MMEEKERLKVVINQAAEIRISYLISFLARFKERMHVFSNKYISKKERPITRGAVRILAKSG